MMAAESAVASCRAVSTICEASSPQRRAISATSTSASAPRSASKSRVRSFTNCASTQPSVDASVAAMPSSRKASEPGRTRRCSLAWRVVSVSRGSTTTTQRLGILGQLPEGVVRVVAAVADARVRAHHQQEARVLEIGVEEGGGRRVEHPLVHQEVLRLLLGQRVEPALRAEAGEPGEAVGGVHVVGLPADPHQADRPWRVLLPDRAEPVRDLGDRRLPGHPLESAVLAPAQRVLDALGVVDVVPDRERLVADVAARDGVGLVGADSGDASASTSTRMPQLWLQSTQTLGRSFAVSGRGVCEIERSTLCEVGATVVPPGRSGFEAGLFGATPRRTSSRRGQ